MIRNGVLALAGLLALAVLVVNSFLIGPSLNLALGGIQERSGTEGRFDQADGNVLYDNVVAKNVCVYCRGRFVENYQFAAGSVRREKCNVLLCRCRQFGDNCLAHND